MDQSYRARSRALCALLGTELPILQAPMAGAQDHEPRELGATELTRRLAQGATELLGISN